MERRKNSEEFEVKVPILSELPIGEFNAALNNYNFCPETVYHYFDKNYGPYKIEQMMIAEVDRRNEESANEDYNNFMINQLGRLACCREEYKEPADLQIQTRMALAQKCLAFMSRPEILENGYSYDQDEYDDLCACFGSSLLCEDHLPSEDKK